MYCVITDLSVLRIFIKPLYSVSVPVDFPHFLSFDSDSVPSFYLKKMKITLIVTSSAQTLISVVLN